ncbi:MAG: 3'-5' exonuclease [Candidatus Aenigmatarchaeota archaeon]|nr:MAG: 3'-5' exonuclease [Candidatus Aenigmarchaeota archaeon]
MIVVDVETTGLNPDRHAIVSIGAVELANPQNIFYAECRAWEGAEVDENALRVNGFSAEQVRDASKKTLDQAMREFLSWTDSCGNTMLAGHNTSFDRDFLSASAKRCGLVWPFAHRTIDLHTVCYTKLLQDGQVMDGLSLNKILALVGLPREPDPHNALTGAKMEAEALSRLIFKRPLLKEFEGFAVPAHL